MNPILRSNDRRPAPTTSSSIKDPTMSSSSSPGPLLTTIMSPAPPPGVLFPTKLHQLLKDATAEGNTHIVSWLPGDGNFFQVHDKVKFANRIMPRYFGSTKYRSFQKNLNLWGFKSMSQKSSPLAHRSLGGGSVVGTAYSHPFFVRDSPVLCQQMIRVPPRTTKKPAATATKVGAKKSMADETSKTTMDSYCMKKEESSGEQDEIRYLLGAARQPRPLVLANGAFMFYY